MQRDTKQELLTKGHALALVHGLGYLTAARMCKETGFYHAAVLHHFGPIGTFREAVKAYGIANGTMSADLVVRLPRLSPADRKNEILGEAFSQARDNGLSTVTRPSVANALDITDGLISRYFGGLLGLRDAVLAKAIVEVDLDIIADAIELGMNIHHVPPDIVSEARKIIAA